jgi:hypothetical protein
MSEQPAWGKVGQNRSAWRRITLKQLISRNLLNAGALIVRKTLYLQSLHLPSFLMDLG